MSTTVKTKKKSIPAGTGPTFAVLGWAITLLDEPVDNGGALLLFEGRTASGGLIPPHTERNHEAFYVLEGEFELEADGEVHRGTPGDYLGVDAGVVHTVRNVGDGWGRILFIAAPGSGHRTFFETIGDPLEPGADPPPLEGPPADFDRIAAVGSENGIDFLPPPEAAG
jgi:quercetin dioxygenase-like cupin family protein